jgi:proton-coupled amino acid transporter
VAIGSGVEVHQIKQNMTDTLNSHRSQREAAVIDRHLPEGYSADPDVISRAVSPDNRSSANETQEESSLLLQGGDIHRDIYKIKARAQGPRRAATFSHAKHSTLESNGVRPHEQMQPGGFRRQYLQRQGLQRSISTVATPVTRNFVNFLELYGSFAGEDLADTDDDESAIDEDEDAHEQEEPTERRPLLARRKSSKRMSRQGDAGTVKTFFTLLKAFVGTGIMFLPKAFRNGGLLFSSITLIVVSLVTSLCFRLLLQCRQRCGGGGYGEIGEAIVGPRFRSILLTSIGLSQLGFVCAGLIFTAENLYSFFEAVTNSRELPIGINSFIAIQLVVLVPLALIRNISKLGAAALLADVFIMIGLVYIWYYDIRSLATRGMDKSVALFNPKDFPLTIGSAIFTFEGIGLILPIQSSMKKPENFSYLLYLIMFIITCIFTSIGALCYATFGESTEIQIISNFPQDSKLVNAVQFLYSLAVLVGEPVQLFPAVRILETKLFGEKATGKRSAAIKWKKNLLRTAVMGLCAVIAIIGASDLDKFVALIGSIACVPLVYIYPAFLHYKGVAESKLARSLDVSLMVLGVVAMVYTSGVTIAQWVT